MDFVLQEKRKEQCADWIICKRESGECRGKGRNLGILVGKTSDSKATKSQEALCGVIENTTVE